MVEHGRHDELVAGGGYYADLHRRQLLREEMEQHRVTSRPEDDPVDQTYDRALLRRLLGYLRPYKLPVFRAFLLIVAMAALDLTGPWLYKVAIDRYIARATRRGLPGIAGLYLLALAARVRGALRHRSTCWP